MDTARVEQNTPDWQAKYALRAGVEGTVRQAIAVTGIRRGPAETPRLITRGRMGEGVR